MSEIIHTYIQNAVRTEKVPYFEMPVDGQIIITQPKMRGIGIIGEAKVRLLHSALGMSTEIAELQQAIDAGDRVNVLEELGDILWYWAIALDALEFRDFLDEEEEDLLVAPLEAERRLTARICAWADLVRRNAIHFKEMYPATAYATLREVWRGVGAVCRAFGISREAVMEMNIAKLRTRFPAQYDGVRFEERDLVAERAALERSPVEEALQLLLALPVEERVKLRSYHHDVLSYFVTLPGGLGVHIAETDLKTRCICIGLPPAPGVPGACPQHPDR